MLCVTPIRWHSQQREGVAMAGVAHPQSSVRLRVAATAKDVQALLWIKASHGLNHNIQVSYRVF